MNEISKKLRSHYTKTFLEYGATSRGVDWGEKEWAANLRQLKMLEIVNIEKNGRETILDVGCGYGALADVIKIANLNLEYTGIDIVQEMIDEAKKRHNDFKFKVSDIFDIQEEKYDYVVCNGILTQKLDCSTLAMNKFAQNLIKKMFDICKNGVVFNTMSSYVNFQKENLYYRNPSEMMAWCMSELTQHIKIDCAYKLQYEYTVYLFKN